MAYRHAKNLLGQQFGRLTVIKLTDERRNGHVMWLCRCTCGNQVLVRGSCLINGGSRSCGNHYRVLLTPEYRAWKKLKSRCSNRNSPIYKYYGGRGITVCKRWLESFENFYEDIGPKPKGRALSLDRIDNDGNYEPGNCRWADQSTQNRNRRSRLQMERLAQT